MKPPRKNYFKKIPLHTPKTKTIASTPLNKAGWRFFLPAIAWAGGILWLSTKGRANLPPLPFDLLKPDKVAHAGAYLLLALLLLWGIHRSSGLSRSGKLWAVSVCGAYGVSMEVLQYCFFPGRYFELYDIIANIIGSFCSLFLLRFIIKQ